MADLLAMSTDIIDNGADHGPINRINHELSEIGDKIALVEAFSHSVVFDTEDGLVVFDTSGENGGQPVVEAIRGWRKTPFRALVYTHGHIDHVGGSGAFIAASENRGDARPQVIGHAQIPKRFARYRLTDGYNSKINARQFRGFQSRGYGIGGRAAFFPENVAEPDVIYQEALSLSFGDNKFDLHHARGETDDHTWAWIPKYKAICAGDFFIWNFPNAGNPQKVQRYPVEWAKALRDMAGREAELFIPAHGLPIQGRARIQNLLTEVAQVLENLVSQTLAMMNQGIRLNDIVHSVKVPAEALAKPWLRPLYDEPEFVINNVWRQFGGWYGGNPAYLKPAKTQALAQELIKLGGGAKAFIDRALALADQGDFRVACHLIELATDANEKDGDAHSARADIYQRRRNQETSMMAKGIFGYAAGKSKLIAEADSD